MPLEDGAELPVRHHLLVGDRDCATEHRVEERRRVALREDQTVVRRSVGCGEVVLQVLGQQDRHQVGAGHPRGGVTGLRSGRATHRIDAELLPELPPELKVVHPHVT
jgi:hypothetical protein